MNDAERMKMPICPVFAVGHPVAAPDECYNLRCIGDQCNLWKMIRRGDGEPKGTCLLREACFGLSTLPEIAPAIDSITT